MPRHTFVYACPRLERLPQGRDEPTYSTVADQLTGADRRTLKAALDQAAYVANPVQEARIGALATRLGFSLLAKDAR